MEFNIKLQIYHIFINGRYKTKTTSWNKANRIFNAFCGDLFEHNHIEIINAETGEIMRERR